MTQVYDIAVLGATPAGYAAARLLASQKRSVVLMDGPHPLGQCPLADWAPADALELPGLAESLAVNCAAGDFDRVCYHNVKLSNRVEYKFRNGAGVFVDYRVLCKALRTEAVAAGVTMRTTSTPPAIHLKEEQVALVGSKQAVARLLLVTHNVTSDLMRELSLPARSQPTGSLTAAGLDVPLTKAKASGLNGALHVVEMPERSELGMFFIMGRVLHLRVITSSPASGTPAAELSTMVANLQRAGILPGNLALAKARGAIWHPPAAAALELESHVAKRCLLTGTAGGFGDSVTGQTIRPSIESALLAAETAAQALDSGHCQETLTNFTTIWRKRMSRYLRPPSTSLQLLLPLVFVNRSILPRFTRALLFGEEI